MKHSIRNGAAVVAGLSALATVSILTTRLAAGTPSPPQAAPRQVQVKFEWTAAADAPGGAVDKDEETLTLVAQEGRTAKVSSEHLQNGAGEKEAVSVLPRLEAGGIVSLDITERSDTTVHGETKANSSETTMRVKSGETEIVRGLTIKVGEQNTEKLLFVTPVIVQATP